MGEAAACGAGPGRGRGAIVCWGELLWDLFPDGPRLGGSSANVAYHAAALGERAVLVSRVGRDELGDQAVRSLGEAGVDVSLVQIDKERPTGTVRVQLDDGEPRFSIVQQTAWDRIDCSAAVVEALQGASALVYGTLAQRTPLGFGALRQALEHTVPGCVRLCDINVRPPFLHAEVVDAALDRADAVKLNESEARTVAELFGVHDVVAWLLQERGVGLVALTRGAGGCRLSTRTATCEHPGYPITDTAVGDRVGAGDAFAAVLASGLARGTELGTLAERANRYAGYVASQRGAMPPVPADLVAAVAR
jgi:fructokinase